MIWKGQAVLLLLDLWEYRCVPLCVLRATNVQAGVCTSWYCLIATSPISVNIILIMPEWPSQHINKHGEKLVVATLSLKRWPYKTVTQIVKLHKQKTFLHDHMQFVGQKWIEKLIRRQLVPRNANRLHTNGSEIEDETATHESTVLCCGYGRWNCNMRLADSWRHLTSLAVKGPAYFYLLVALKSIQYHETLMFVAIRWPITCICPLVSY